MSRICIVTPDTVGPVKNGGIGTHCYNLAIYLHKQGHEITLIFTAKRFDDCSQWKAVYAQKGIKLLYCTDLPKIHCQVQLPDCLATSFQIFTALRNEQFDQIHFQDWLANGFHCIQAKHTLGDFAHTLLTVTAHSNTEWINEGMQQWNGGGLAETKLSWAERYCVCHCDLLISPSAYMLEWLQKRQWKIAAKHQIIPNIFLPEGSPRPYAPDVGVIAFFGRLETRKGLEIFCKGLRSLPAQDAALIRKILFVGKIGACGSTLADNYIATQLGAFKSRIELHTELDTFGAQELLRQRRALVVLPSLMDNLPYSGIECVVMGIPALAARTGGFSEIFDAGQLFEPTAAGVCEALSKALHGQWQPSPPMYSGVRAEQGWSEVALQRCPQMPESLSEYPLISVCMSHYNHGEYLPAALQALADQDYPNFEVIVVDDGSSEEKSQKVFAQLSCSMDARFKFISKKNEGLAITRNQCAKLYANGDFLVFCDADNISEPHMLSTLAKAIVMADLDVVTCHCFGFTQEEHMRNRVPWYRYAPLGADCVSGILENVFGDANFIIRKYIFLKLDGFKETRNSWEDWDILARAALSGKKLDTIPEVLFWYRVTGSGMTGTTSQSANHRMILESYSEHVPLFAARIFRDLLVPTTRASGMTGYENSVIVNFLLHCGVQLEALYCKFFPQGSLLQKMASSFRRIVTRNRGK